MRFQVPQFIEKESKLVGPLTLKQFGWYAGAGIIILITQFFVEGTAMLITGSSVLLVASALAFAKIDEVPLPTLIGRAFLYFLEQKKFRYDEKTPANRFIR